MEAANNLRLRNLAVIAHVDHGKSTLADSLIQAAGISNKERFMDSAKPEQMERIVTIVSSGARLHFDDGDDGGGALVVNMIDTPGHVDFSAEVSASLRLADGALLVVDAASGMAVQTRTVIRQSLQEHLRIVLVINKLDRLLLELDMESEALYFRLRRIVEEVNAELALHARGEDRHPELNPLAGNVIFACGKGGWGFSLPQLADLYAARSGKSAAKILPLLWGDRFNAPGSKRWSRNMSSGAERGFSRFVLGPIRRLIAATSTFEATNWKQVDEELERFGVRAKSSRKAASTKQEKKKSMSNRVLCEAFSASVPLLRVIERHLPSPEESQKRRLAHLWQGGTQEQQAGIRDCDAEGPLAVFITKMVPSKGSKQVLAFGRIFSGTLRDQDEVLVLGSDGSEPRLATVRSVSYPLGGGNVDSTIQSARAGEVVCLSGIASALRKSGTLVRADKSAEAADGQFVPIMFSVFPVVRLSVRAKRAADLDKLSSALSLLSKFDPVLEILSDPNLVGGYIVGAAGELHMEVSLSDLRALAGVEVVVSEPIVSYRETVVSEEGGATALAKSTNKHNRVWSSAQQLPPALVQELERDENFPRDAAERCKAMAELGVSKAEVTPKSVWAVGASSMEASEFGRNMLCDKSSGVPYLSEANPFFISAFREVTRQGGPLCGEPLRGVRINVTDCKLHKDRAHRGQSQLHRACCRSFQGAILQGDARLLEPMFRVTIEAPASVAGTLYSFVSRRRGQVVDEQRADGNATVVAHVPVAESIGWDAALREETAGTAFSSTEFSHWQLIDSDPLEDGTLANKVVREIRQRKNLEQAMPNIDAFVDRL